MAKYRHHYRSYAKEHGLNPEEVIQNIKTGSLQGEQEDGEYFVFFDDGKAPAQKGNGKKFFVFQHPILGTEIVKDGFSWPGFFFSWIWAFVKRLWVHGIVIILATIIFATPLTHIDLNTSNSAVIAALALNFVPYLVCGFFGNKWRFNNLGSRGYEHIDTVWGSTADSVLATRGKQVMPPLELANQISESTRACPACGETIKSVARKCKHCGEVVAPLAGEHAG